MTAKTMQRFPLRQFIAVDNHPLPIIVRARRTTVTPANEKSSHILVDDDPYSSCEELDTYALAQRPLRIRSGCFYVLQFTNIALLAWRVRPSTKLHARYCASNAILKDGTTHRVFLAAHGFDRDGLQLSPETGLTTSVL